MSALTTLEQLRGEVGARRERVIELDEARTAGARSVERARAELLDFYRERERGGPPVDIDTATGNPMPVEGETSEAELIESLRAAEGGLTMRAVSKPQGTGSAVLDVELEVFDSRAEAMHTGAVEALNAAEKELRTFASANLAELAAERVERATTIRKAAVDAFTAARVAADAYEGERAWWTGVLNVAERPELIADLPDNPVAWVGLVPQEVPLPLPESFTP